MKRLFVLSCLAVLSLCFGQETLIRGGEQFRLDALPTNILVSMPRGEKRSITIDETLSNYCLWTARHTVQGSQTIIYHNVQEAMGGLTAPMGAATVEFVGNQPIDCHLDLVLARPGDTQNAPLAVIRCHLVVYEVQAPIAPAPVVVTPPIPLPPAPPRKILIKDRQYFLMNEVPALSELMVRRDGGELVFYLENREYDKYEWVAMSNDRIEVSIDNDETIQAHIPGHKHKRDIKVSEIEIKGFEPCDTRVIFEYRRVRSRPGERPLKTMHLNVKVR